VTQYSLISILGRKSLKSYQQTFKEEVKSLGKINDICHSEEKSKEIKYIQYVECILE